MLFFALAAVIVFATSGGVWWYGAIAFGVLGIKLAAAVLYRPTPRRRPADLVIAAVVPTFNEDPVVFELCLRSLLSQEKPIDEIWVIDDGSPDDSCHRMATTMLANRRGGHVIRFDANRGKRHAMAVAFRESNADLFLTVDSDTVLEPDAVIELASVFGDDAVEAATGSVRALNPDASLLARLIDLRYANAFLFERAAYSWVGSVLCCCGSLAMYRAATVKDNLDDFLSQTFLGVPVQFGDDRRLTNYALARGRVLFAERARGYTAVPSTLSHFVRQQVRWNKSFFRETLHVLKGFPRLSWPWLISAVELVLWVTLTLGLVGAVFIRPAMVGWAVIIGYLANVVFASYARSVRFFAQPSLSKRSDLSTFLLSPAYAVVHVLLLIPLRVWTLCTLKQGSWGTRQSGVEVGIDAVKPRAVPAWAGATEPADASAHGGAQELRATA